MSMDTLAAQRAGLIRDICEHPQRDDLRLIFADWCEDHGEPERDEFVRLEIAREVDLDWHESTCAEDLPCKNCRRVDKLLASRSRDIPDRSNLYAWAIGDESLRRLAPGIEFRRGFVRKINADLETFYDHAETVFRLNPVVVVDLVDRVPFQGTIAGGHTQHNLRGNPYWRWNWASGPDMIHHPWYLPKGLAMFFDKSKCIELSKVSTPFCYLSEHDAKDALSFACVNFIRDKIGLPMIQP